MPRRRRSRSGRRRRRRSATAFWTSAGCSSNARAVLCGSDQNLDDGSPLRLLHGRHRSELSLRCGELPRDVFMSSKDIQREALCGFTQRHWCVEHSWASGRDTLRERARQHRNRCQLGGLAQHPAESSSDRLLPQSPPRRPPLGLRHVGEARQVQLVRDRHRSCRSCAVLGDYQVCFTTARVITFKRIRSMQQDHHVAILFYRSRFA